MFRRYILAAAIIALAAAGLCADKFGIIDIVPSAFACDDADPLCG